jgi:arsenate reductase-like glutaredoxin family protein
LQKSFTLKERDFFKEPFNREEIKGILKDSPPSEMFNFKSPSFKELGVEAESLSDDKLIELMSEEPRLVRRPVVVIDGKPHFGASQKVLADILNL